MNEVGFGTGNWIALILYLIATLLVGVYFTKELDKIQTHSSKQR